MRLERARGMSKLYKSALNPHKSRHNPRLLSRRLVGNFGISDKCLVYMNENPLYWLPNHHYTRIAILHPAKFNAARDYYLFELYINILNRRILYSHHGQTKCIIYIIYIYNKLFFWAKMKNIIQYIMYSHIYN